MRTHAIALSLSMLLFVPLVSAEDDPRAVALTTVDSVQIDLASLQASNAASLLASQQLAGAAGRLGAEVKAVIALWRQSGDCKNAELAAALQELEMTNNTVNLQYLSLQQKMQNENRQFTSVSNILKTKHDTVKNSINNIR